MSFVAVVVQLDDVHCVSPSLLELQLESKKSLSGKHQVSLTLLVRWTRMVVPLWAFFCSLLVRVLNDFIDSLVSALAFCRSMCFCAHCAIMHTCVISRKKPTAHVFVRVPFLRFWDEPVSGACATTLFLDLVKRRSVLNLIFQSCGAGPKKTSIGSSSPQ